MKKLVVIPLILAFAAILPIWLYADYTLSSTASTDAIATWGGTAERTAVTFTTTGAGTISAVDWCGRLGSGTPVGVAVSIWADSSGTPGSLLATSDTRGGFTSTAARMTYTFSSPVNVSAATTYWVGFNLAGLSGGEVQNCGLGSTGTYADKYSTNGGSNWSAEQTWEQNYSFTVVEAAPGLPLDPNITVYTNNGSWVINNGILHIR